jgi:hypothetical protein
MVKKNNNNKPIKNNKNNNGNSFYNFLDYLHNNVQTINNSKIFAGIMIITLNVVSKFANIKLSKTLESYFKYTFSKQILVFAIAWMGTRDIYIALFITFVFVIFTEYFFHEESTLCILPKSFSDYHISLLDDEKKEKITDEDVAKAKEIIEKAKYQKSLEFSSYNNSK